MRNPELFASRSESTNTVSATQRSVARSIGFPRASRISSAESSGDPSRRAATSRISRCPFRAEKR
jgi:hypothetical protein